MSCVVKIVILAIIIYVVTWCQCFLFLTRSAIANTVHGVLFNQNRHDRLMRSSSFIPVAAHLASQRMPPSGQFLSGMDFEGALKTEHVGDDLCLAQCSRDLETVEAGAVM